MSVAALVVAIVLFVLAGLGVTVGELGELDLIAFGLAAFAFAFVVGAIPPWPRR